MCAIPVLGLSVSVAKGLVYYWDDTNSSNGQGCFNYSFIVWSPIPHHSWTTPLPRPYLVCVWLHLSFDIKEIIVYSYINQLIAFHKKRILLQLLLHVFVREAKKEEEKRQLKSTIQNKKSDVVASLPRM